jgi:FHA domain-containing protein
MSPFALTLMKFGLLLLLYLFVWRAVRSVAVGFRRGAGVGAGGSTGSPPPLPPPRKAGRKGESRTPTSVAIRTKEGKRIGSYQLTGTIDIGRAEGCAIRLSDTYSSQQHARLSAKDGRWVVEDLGSTNGTFLNEKRIESAQEVHAGDRIRIGTTVLELRS